MKHRTGSEFMPGSIRLGRLGKTEISVHVLFVPILAGAAWFGATQYGGVGGGIFGLLLVLLLFACVLLHEIAHSVQAHACGLEVQSIVLLPTGGLANLDVTAVKPQDEKRIALAGPLANLALGLVLNAIILLVALPHFGDIDALMFEALQRPSVLGLLIYLAMANVTLGLFNLLPAFPLDGGRAFRAGLSQRMPFEEATRRAAIVGRSFGAGLGAMGIAIIVLGELPYGLALILVAAILYTGATYENQVVQQDAALRRWTVGQVFRAAPQTVTPDEPLSAVLNSIARGIVVPVIVGEQARLVGLITASDVRPMITHHAFDSLSVAHVMRTRFPKVRSTDPLWIAYAKLRRFQLYAIPVVSHQNLCGLVTLSDIRHVLRDGGPKPS